LGCPFQGPNDGRNLNTKKPLVRSGSPSSSTRYLLISSMSWPCLTYTPKGRLERGPPQVGKEYRQKVPNYAGNFLRAAVPSRAMLVTKYVTQPMMPAWLASCLSSWAREALMVDAAEDPALLETLLAELDPSTDLARWPSASGETISCRWLSLLLLSQHGSSDTLRVGRRSRRGLLPRELPSCAYLRALGRTLSESALTHAPLPGSEAASP
jgi:hypothetical protein